MNPQSEVGACLIEAMNGSHLQWLDFRDNVLRPFQIRCTNSPRSEHLPTTFLARLQSFQKNLLKYDAQRQQWRLDVPANQGFNASGVFPPHLVPALPASTFVSRCMLPRMSREDLPLRVLAQKSSLYELPTAKPAYICGFNLDIFDKSEQSQLNGALGVVGTVVDYEKGEVSTGKTVCCPFLAFEKFATTSEKEIETARNQCAITGAQYLRSQQQLFHKAFGLQTVSQPPIAFSCAISNEHAVINLHCIDEDGSYTMAALCKFNLEDDQHFNTFQAWIEAIESWASLYLLPRIKGALGQVVQSNQTPPLSPVSSLGSLSIDTNSDNSIIMSLRQYWPDITWRHGGIGETPINSSIAQCGTPLPARNLYSQLLPCPPSNSSLISAKTSDNDTSSFLPKRPSQMLSPIQTNFWSPYASQTPRRYSALSSVSRSLSDVGSTTPISACRPPSLSPSTPGPEAPVSSRSPMLVLQKRLDIAMNEIQELRGQVEELQSALSYKTDRLEARIEMILESRQATPVASSPNAYSNISPTEEEAPFQSLDRRNQWI
ncbi:hypothetical protein H2198_008491 [Neophaeococcomyces mojaviensis]|uniref:Uncharacterized protein n=1 Tax=Neophaeococcomyces mojaviensis TaxID=3383035 RepID=A0ACC2ZX33_9EURO|nr:hypothetical protein H2198_008491 [Knufia sp. JES_112]